MTPEEFGEWLKGRCLANSDRFNGRHMGIDEYERAYAREDEAEEILAMWEQVEIGNSES